MNYLSADWPLQHVYHTGITLSSHPHYLHGFNLALNLAQDENQRAQIQQNRAQLQAALPNNTQPLWLTQTHSDTILTTDTYQPQCPADALISQTRTLMPIVLTADCIPVLIADEQQSAWAAVHAGWQGVYQNIIGKTVRAMPLPAKRLWVWLAPSIQQRNYEVDQAFYERFVAADHRYKSAFVPNRANHYLADLPAIARLQLRDAGVPTQQIYQSALCTFDDKRFFSYRRDKALSGRMASFIVPR